MAYMIDQSGDFFFIVDNDGARLDKSEKILPYIYVFSY